MTNAKHPIASAFDSRSGLIESERIRLLFRLAPRTLAINLLIAALSVMALWGEAGHEILLGWLATAVLAITARGTLCVAYSRADPARPNPGFWENAFSIGAAAMGSTWAWLALIGPLPLAHDIFVVFVVGGLAMGAAGVLGASRKAFLCFVAPMLTAQIGELFWVGGDLFTIMGAMGVIFSFGLAAAYAEFRRALLEAMEARLKIEQLHNEQRLLFDTATVGIAFIRDRKIVDCNRWFADLLGYPPDELTGSSTRMFFPSDESWDEIGRRAYSGAKEGKAFRGQLVLRRKDGTRITCDVSADSLLARQPEQGIVAIFNDVSARKQAERDLQKALQEQLAIFDNAVVGIAYMRNGVVQNCNSRYAALFGYRQEDMIGQSTRVFHSSDENWTEGSKIAYAAIAKGEAYSFEEEYVRKDGERFWCRGYGRAIDPAHPEEAVYVLIDVTDQKHAEIELREALAEQRTIFDNSAVGLARIEQRSVTLCNQRFAEILGYPDPAELIGKSTRLWYASEEDWEQQGGVMYDSLRHNERYSFENEFVRKDGKHIWVQVQATALDPGNPYARAILIFSDISEQKRAEQELRRSREQFELVIQAAQSGIWDWNIVENTTYYSPRFKEILGYPVDADFSALFAISDRLHPEDRKRMLAALEAHLRQRVPFDHEYRLRYRDESYVWVRGRGQAVWDGNGEALRFVGSISDITDHKRDEEKIRQLAEHDPLTGLPNRRLLSDRLKQARALAHRNKEKLAVMMLDLDGFKKINDTRGHETGDVVLVSTAKRLRECVRESDTVARFGGDEFVIVLEGQRTAEESSTLAEKILASLREPVAVAGAKFVVGASIGIAVFPKDGDDAETLINMADKAMYRAKRSGGNRYSFYAREDATGDAAAG